MDPDSMPARAPSPPVRAWPGTGGGSWRAREVGCGLSAGGAGGGAQSVRSEIPARALWVSWWGLLYEKGQAQETKEATCSTSLRTSSSSRPRVQTWGSTVSVTRSRWRGRTDTGQSREAGQGTGKKWTTPWLIKKGPAATGAARNQVSPLAGRKAGRQTGGCRQNGPGDAARRRRGGADAADGLVGGLRPRSPQGPRERAEQKG